MECLINSNLCQARITKRICITRHTKYCTKLVHFILRYGHNNTVYKFYLCWRRRVEPKDETFYISSKCILWLIDKKGIGKSICVQCDESITLRTQLCILVTKRSWVLWILKTKKSWHPWLKLGRRPYEHDQI